VPINNTQKDYLRGLYSTDPTLRQIVEEHGMLALQHASVEIYDENAISKLIQQTSLAGTVSPTNWNVIVAASNADIDVSLMKAIAEAVSSRIASHNAAGLLPLLLGLLACVRRANNLPPIEPA
jgi:hypothetical protein